MGKLPARARRAALGVLLLALLAVPFATSGYILRLLTLLFTFAVMAEAWNLIGGFAGYVDFGSVVFFGLGGYTTGLLMTKLKLPFVAGWLAGAALCTVFAILMGLLLLRLRGHYFGIATLGTSFAVREIIANWPSVTGGGTGISLPIYDFPNSVFYFIMLGLLIAIVGLTWWLSRNRLGFGLVAIRENEQAAEVLGVNALRYKVTAYALSGFFIGMTGGAYAYWITFIDPTTIFDVGITVEVIIMAVLGGAGSVAGPLIGAAILTVISEILNAYVPNAHLTVLGAIIVLVVLLIPNGVIEYLTFKRKLSLKSIGATLAQTRV
ncbi:MAG TPA: branched-chain amino acid ABC transporter permease [Chloroflexota bacterium]|nr:branched-chain amino acid ABC transporter permease [Chloroflexota bacterium]